MPRIPKFPFRIVSVSRKDHHEVDGKRTVTAQFQNPGDVATAAKALSSHTSVLFEVEAYGTRTGKWIKTGYAYQGEWSQRLPARIVAQRAGRGLSTPQALLMDLPSTFEVRDHY